MFNLLCLPVRKKKIQDKIAGGMSNPLSLSPVAVSKGRALPPEDGGFLLLWRNAGWNDTYSVPSNSRAALAENFREGEG